MSEAIRITECLFPFIDHPSVGGVDDTDGCVAVHIDTDCWTITVYVEPDDQRYCGDCCETMDPLCFVLAMWSGDIAGSDVGCEIGIPYGSDPLMTPGVAELCGLDHNALTDDDKRTIDGNDVDGKPALGRLSKIHFQDAENSDYDYSEYREMEKLNRAVAALEKEQAELLDAMSRHGGN